MIPQKVQAAFKEAKAKLAQLRKRRLELLNKDAGAAEEAKRKEIYGRLSGS